MEAIMHKPRRHTPLIPIAGLVILLIADVTVVNLWLLVNLYERTARSSSALSAIQYGVLVTRDLEQQPFFRKSSIGKDDAKQFGQVVDALQMLEPGLEYVSVSERGAIIYHKQARRGQFHTQIMMPDNIEGVGAQAVFDNDVLRVQIPKATETNFLVRSITIR